jgi:predicted dehydrogenase/nucleoside-diphosphate-sugar epimerase
MSKTILLCGHKSYASFGLRESLEAAGYDVYTFSRGVEGQHGKSIAGSVFNVHENQYLPERVDIVINYILLKDGSVNDNIKYIDSLVQFCNKKEATHLIHLSSISVYKDTLKHIDENSAAENVPERKGSYGSLKVATDNRLLEKFPSTKKLTLIRPGFILGTRLVNPIVGIGLKLPWNNALVLGNAKSQIPLISRELLNESIQRIIKEPPLVSPEVLLLASRNSPTRKKYLDTCCRELGVGKAVTSWPVFFWLTLAAGGELVARLIGQASLKPWAKIRSICRYQRFDPTHSEKRLGIQFDFDWQKKLVESMDGQEQNYTVLPLINGTFKKPVVVSLGFIGFGRIVKQKHLPALKKINFTGKIKAYDLIRYLDTNNQVVESVEDFQPDCADALIVATPGPAHAESIKVLAGSNACILVEKPLCVSVEEFEQWKVFAQNRQAPVYACHNYRYKENVLKLFRFIAGHNPGKLQHVSVDFFSPPVSWDSVSWLRQERVARTLLLDYSLHFLDIACMFNRDPWTLPSIRYDLNMEQQTSLIEGCAMSKGYSVNFLLRQGFGPRRAKVTFHFRNYLVFLGFFPDTFAVCMANDNPFLYGQEQVSSGTATLRKIYDKLTGKDSDLSHARLLASFLSKDERDLSWISVQELQPFYDLLFKIENRVYSSSE